MKPVDEAFWREQFHRSQESFHWFLKALGLKRAADQLAPVALDDLASIFDPSRADESPLAHPPVIGAYMVLAGLAIETLAKAILIDRDPSRVQEGVLKRWPGGAHPIVEVCKQVGVPWTGSELDLFDRLSDDVTWVGRYPIPLKERDLVRHASRRGGLGTNMQQSDPMLIDQVWNMMSCPDGVRTSIQVQDGVMGSHPAESGSQPT